MKQRKSPRAQRYDYTSPWGYFITICTKDRVYYFGEIVNNTMQLNLLGQYCDQEIQRISERQTVDIHERIVMPNHIHLLLVISNFTDDMNIWYINDRRDALHANEYANGRDAFETRHNNDNNLGHATSMSLPITNMSLPIKYEDYHWPRLWQIIGVLKWNISKYANANDILFARQWRYHDHIIRNEYEYAL
jgi:REP element-mobilizing transposase RayT